MQITKLRTCWIISVVITVFVVGAMALFDVVMNPSVTPAMGHSGIAGQRGTALHAVLTASLIFPASLFVVLLVRRANLLNAELRRIIDRDRLTNAASRDLFFRKMTEEPDAIGVSLMVDIDHFKRVNDMHGHIEGDRVLKQVAEVLTQGVRSRDIVCRFGGEEFMIFLYDHSKHEGQIVAQRLCQAVEGYEIMVGDQRVVVTISVGGAMKGSPDRIEKVIPIADAALYQAKIAGRNCAVFSPDVVDPASAAA